MTLQPMCTKPILAHQPDPGTQVRLNAPIGSANLRLNCGNCDECRTRKAAQWGMRGMHEATLWQHNSFIHLTLNDKHLDEDGGLLNARRLELFTKRLRNRARREPNDILGDRKQPIRYIACGEHGEHTGRPHFHMLAYNCDFPDAYTVANSKNGNRLYRSPILDELWTDNTGEPIGIANFGIATPGAAAAYMASYATKARHKHDLADADGVVIQAKEFLRMSRRPIIGAGWLEKYSSDLRNGYIVDNGSKQPIPRAYVNHLTKYNPDLVAEILARKDKRRVELGPVEDNEPERQAARDIINRQKLERAEQRRSL